MGTERKTQNKAQERIDCYPTSAALGSVEGSERDPYLGCSGISSPRCFLRCWASGTLLEAASCSRVGVTLSCARLTLSGSGGRVEAAVSWSTIRCNRGGMPEGGGIHKGSRSIPDQ